MIGPADIDAAAARIAGRVRRTPVLWVDERGWPPVALKLEFLQHSGSFKARGAFNAMLSAASIPAAGVVAASGGNHGAAVAYAAQTLGIPARIFVPLVVPDAKAARIADYGVWVERSGDNYAGALSASREYRDRTGALELHAYDDDAVLAGQGTIGREMEADAPDLSHVLVATGGGGLIGGIAAWYGGRVQVVSVEPEGCPAMHNALLVGRPVLAHVGGIAADSLGASEAGGRSVAIALATGVQAVLVPDAAIADARRWLWERLRIMSEPGGAAALAAILCGAFVPPPGARVGIVLCGANTDPAKGFDL